ncbi:hypothetical protein M427DRAFT_70179 [Gonapodya prolifera JEL478]|uniref:F-box domain-containing protein n=1 Tax=Gonapodya prolifera (strain JEL478) TaxID=1344416 RepID=A0A139AE39_GONPJ|nr:hypothetical protein M427DRAFT_70179 [Gonapodya prolifera JEL478]|eukprot:KXS15082.1 hypothetical protein M427DRAFT_70179 [Gonapodya prolifera JEL478]
MSADHFATQSANVHALSDLLPRRNPQSTLLPQMICLSAPTHLLDLPFEILEAIFSFLATDSLASSAIACRNGGRIARELRTWSGEHHLRVENTFGSSEKFQKAIQRAISVPLRAIFNGDASASASCVTMVTLDREYMPIDVTLIGRILDTFTSVREARFVGCLAFGSDFVEMGSKERVSRWMGGALRVLDLSDSKGRVMAKAKGPLGRNHCTGETAWKSFMDSWELTLMMYTELVHDVDMDAETILSFVAYPLLYTSCDENPAYSWNLDGFLRLLPPFWRMSSVWDSDDPLGRGRGALSQVPASVLGVHAGLRDVPPICGVDRVFPFDMPDRSAPSVFAHLRPVRHGCCFLRRPSHHVQQRRGYDAGVSVATLFAQDYDGPPWPFLVAGSSIPPLRQRLPCARASSLLMALSEEVDTRASPPDAIDDEVYFTLCRVRLYPCEMVQSMSSEAPNDSTMGAFPPETTATSASTPAAAASWTAQFPTLRATKTRV